jgi:hypothetical protein
LGAKPEIKKWAKKTMPFVQFMKARIEEKGLHALDLTLDFDEAEVIVLCSNFCFSYGAKNRTFSGIAG